MTIHDLDQLIDIINDFDIVTPSKLIITAELYEELTSYNDFNGGKFTSNKNHLFYRDFEIIKDK